MKKALLTLMCMAATLAASTSLRAQEVTIVLMPGYNWLGIPSTDTLDFATALGSFTPLTGDIIQSQWGNATYRNGQWYGGISQFYPGYGYMYYSKRTMPVMVTFNAQQPAPQVVVTTSEPMLITAISAMGGGEVTVSDGTYIIVKGLCWATHENPTTNDDFYQEAESGVGSFSLSMTGLNISTTYYVRAYAVTGDGTVYGDQKTFTTRDGIPSVTTADVTNIMAESATCGGTVTDNCGLTVIARGVCWSTSPTPTLDDSHTTNGSGNGSFSSYITGLNVSTTYYVRAYATTTVGTSYGEQKTFTTRDGLPEMSTAPVTNILGSIATCGGTITGNCGLGLTITDRGVCWSTAHNPTISDNHESDPYFDYFDPFGSFTIRISGLNFNTTYYVRAYAANSVGIGYGEEVSFTTLPEGAHGYVDLGLPSGTLWATCNVGATTPEDYGHYFAWGETQPKSTYNWSTYQHCMGSENTLTKYCNNSDCGYNGFVDNLTILLPEDDVAAANWGEDWRMPTQEEWLELRQNTTSTFTYQNGVYGMRFTAVNGNSIFLPATQVSVYEYGGDKYEYPTEAYDGYYWSSSLHAENPKCAWYFHAHKDGGGYCVDPEQYMIIINNSRCKGQSVRPVRSASQSTYFSINAMTNLAEGVISGGGNYQEGAECTLTATANEGYVFMYWTENGELVSTEATYTFIVNRNRFLWANFAYTSGGHSYVNLGLPSGTLWATCNVGADAPIDYGDYFAWGETESKTTYNWSTYQYCNGSYNTLTKYCNKSSYGYNGFTDNLTILLPEDDAATANWGNGWRMPTMAEWQELYNNTTCTWTTQNGVNGRLFTASNGNNLFLPAAGCRDDGGLYYAGSYGFYWSSSLDSGSPSDAWYFYFSSGSYYMVGRVGRRYGRSVRPVRTTQN